MIFNEKVKQLSEAIDERLLPVINRSGKIKECVYLDLPYYPNIGDTLIWRGTEHFFKRTGLKCLYASSLTTYSERKMQRVNNSNKKIMIFLQGGGNFGDLWEEFQIFRKKIINGYPNSQIIILPQTVFYRDSRKMKIDAEFFAKHRNLTICARDKKSYRILKENFSNEIILVPDMAFCIPQKELKKYAAAQIPNLTLLLKRADKELNNSIGYSKYIYQKQFYTHDWVTLEKNCIEERMTRRLTRWKTVPNFAADLYAKIFFQKTMIREGIRQISKYENIYSTRLHAAILSLLLEKPFVLFDNSYGKNSSFFETWLSGLNEAKLYK
jgi:pyruvyl transferase EpsO